MDEAQAIIQARKLIKELKLTELPVSLPAYLDHLNAVVKYVDDLDPDESGITYPVKDGFKIAINKTHNLGRQRFTVCHEIAHIYLKLPSDHAAPRDSYASKSKIEMACDTFAAEILLPNEPFKRAADLTEISLSSVESLSQRFGASLTATASRYASVLGAPCAYVMSEVGKIRYATLSVALRETGAKIARQVILPRGSLTEAVRRDKGEKAVGTVSAETWFNEWDRGGTLKEEVLHWEKFDQTITLLWFEDGETPRNERGDRQYGRLDDEDEDLKELDGNLRWSSRDRK